MIWRLLSWYGLIVLLGWVCFPLSYRLFRKLPERGYTLSRILGLLLWGFTFWLLGSLRLLQNHPGGILFALMILIGISVWAGWGKWDEIWGWVKTHWRLIILAESVFLISFAFMALVRASDPDATGTEKPMELAFINAILNSKTFPPNDPWLSGYAISYYHFGYILAGMLAKLTFTSGGVAFNLMLASTFAMSAVGAYGVMVSLISEYGNTIKNTINKLTWALLGPLFLLFVSNLEVLLEMLHQAGVGWDLETGTSRFWQWINIESLRNPPSKPLSLIPQRFWWWWQASRVVHDIDLLGNVSGLSPIDEFPAFSYVLGDLHPHVLVMPFVMLLIGLALNIFLGGMDQETRLFGIVFPIRWDLFIISAITLGGIAFLNTWDLPVYFALIVGSFLFWQVKQKGWAWERLFDTLKLAIPLGILSLLLYLPFFISFQSQAGGILPNIIYPTRGLYLWLMFGALFVPIFLLFLRQWREKAKFAWGWGFALAFSLVIVLIVLSIGLGYMVAQSPIGLQVLASQGKSTYAELLSAAMLHRLRFSFGLLTLTILLALGFSFLVRSNKTHNNDTVTFVFLMVVLGGLMVLAPEFIYLRDNFGVRMNTIFKFYYQAWMLWSLAAGFSAVVILSRRGWLSKTLVLVMILLGLIYPVLAFRTKTNQFSPANGYTLDASAYLATYQPNEAAAIHWVSKAPFGVVAEAIGGQYTGYARVSTLSGQPTVLGWPGHEGQWRGGYEEVGSREGDIRTLYETADWERTLSIIRQYDIRYIFVGSLETSKYALNPTKFERNLGLGFEQGGVQVFVVPESLFQY